MKHLKKSNTYTNSTKTLTFNMDTMTGHSYSWYVIAKRINGIMVLNNYSYSATTIKHVWELRKLFNALCIDYVEIEAPKGLQDLESSKALYENRINSLIAETKKPKTRKSTNLERLRRAGLLATKLKQVMSYANT